MRHHLFCAGGSDQRVHDRVERLTRSLVPEHQVADLLSIETPDAIEHTFAKFAHDLFQTRRAGLHHVTRQLVSVDHRDAEVAEHLRHGGFSARDPTR